VRACVLLRETDIPVVQIAMNVGFQTQGQSTVSFHRVVQQTPRAYRVGRAVEPLRAVLRRVSERAQECGRKARSPRVS
jgi:AraC-like DNA-binding protein